MGNMDLEDLGDKIQDIIESAVKSHDFQKLNQTITQAVNSAIDNGSDALKSALGVNRKNDPEAYKRYRYTPPESFRKKETVKEEDKEPALYLNTAGDKVKGIAMAGCGALLAFGNGAALLSGGFLRMLFGGGGGASTVFLSIFFAIGVGLIAAGTHLVGKVNRFRKYISTLGKKNYCEVEELSKATAKPVRFVRREIKKMVTDGWFLEGHMDEKETVLITSNETFRQYEEMKKKLEEKRREELKEQAKKPVITPQVQEILDKGQEYLKEIGKCNEAISGEEISAKISEIEEIVSRILERAAAHPEVASDLKKLMNYYLPMTIKLLNAYAEMEKQPIQGENIRKSKKEIEDTLDTLKQAFEKLLDTIFTDTALDVSSDISVLNTLLAQEGLKDDGLHATLTQSGF